MLHSTHFSPHWEQKKDFCAWKLSGLRFLWVSLLSWCTMSSFWCLKKSNISEQALKFSKIHFTSRLDINQMHRHQRLNVVQTIFSRKTFYCSSDKCRKQNLRVFSHAVPSFSLNQSQNYTYRIPGKASGDWRDFH